jgi:hypothetical protein
MAEPDDMPDLADGPALLAWMGNDGARWAKAFCVVAKSHGHDLDEGWALGWFCNALMAGWDAAHRFVHAELSDG